MVDINDFYKRVLTGLDVEVVDDYLMIEDGDKQTPLTDKGVPLVLPTKKSISSLLAEDDEGNIITVKKLFNPMDETVIKGDSVSLTKLKKLVNVRLSNRITIAGSLLLSIAENTAHQSKTSMLVNQFLVRLNEAKNPGMTKVVDSKTIDKWLRLYDASLKPNNTKFLSVFVKKGGKIGTVKYNRVTTLKFPIYEELCGLGKSGVINGVALRNKDIKVFKILFEYLIEGIDERGIVTVGSNNGECPGFITLYGLYLKVMGKVQEVVGSIKGVNPEWEDSAGITLSVDHSELSSLDSYKKAVAGLPREGDVIRSKLAQQSTVIQTPAINEAYAPQPQQHATAPVEPEVDPSTAAIRKAVYQGVSGVNVPMTNAYPPAGYPQQQATPTYGQPTPGYYGQTPMNGQPVAPVMQPQFPMAYQQPQQYPPEYQQPSMGIGAYGTTSPFGSDAPPPQPQIYGTGWGR